MAIVELVVLVGPNSLSAGSALIACKEVGSSRPNGQLVEAVPSRDS